MRSASTRVAVLNSLLFIRDPTTDERLDIDGHGAVWSGPGCIAVSCLPDADGDTMVTLGPAEEVGRDVFLLFDATLDTPSRTVVVETVLWERLLEVEAPDTRSRVRIWTDGHQGTARVTIGLG